MMQEAIEKFASQFAFDPEVRNADQLKPATMAIIAGMGGSHLAADLCSPMIRVSSDDSQRLWIAAWIFGFPMRCLLLVPILEIRRRR